MDELEKNVQEEQETQVQPKVIEQVDKPLEQPADQPAQAEPEDKFEKESYNEFSYNQVQRKRLQGKMYGVQVPYLNFHLHKADKPRTKYVVFGSLLITLAALVLVVAAIFLIGAIIPVASNGVDTPSPQWDIFHVVEGLQGMAIGLALIVLFGLLFAIVILGVFIFLPAMRCFHLAKANKEEMAYGLNMDGLMWQAIIAAVVAFAMFFVVPFVMKDSSAYWVTPLPYILIVFALLLIGVAVIIIVDKFKAVKWFKENLTPEEQENYKAHVRALERVKRRKESSNRTSRGIFGGRF